MDKNQTFPVYFKATSHNRLYAFVAKDKMYKIEDIGSNMNPGVTVDHYITRNMVLKHWGSRGHQITEEEFKRLYNRLFTSLLDRMTYQDDED